MKVLLKKLRADSAFSMTEMLVTTLILGLMTIGLATGITSSMRVYYQSVTYSEERMLLSTLSEAIISELRHSKEAVINSDGKLETYTSSIYGFEVELLNDSGSEDGSGSTWRVKANTKDGKVDLISDGNYSKQTDDDGNTSYRICAKLYQTDAENASEGIKFVADTTTSGNSSETGTDSGDTETMNGHYEAYLKVWPSNQSESTANVKEIYVVPREMPEKEDSSSK